MLRFVSLFSAFSRPLCGCLVLRDGEQKNPGWVLALVAPTPALDAKPIDERKALVLEDMRRRAEAKGLQPHECPLRVEFVDGVFTQENGLRNANEKLLWTEVEKRYSTLITQAYAEPLTAVERGIIGASGH